MPSNGQRGPTRAQPGPPGSQDESTTVNEFFLSLGISSWKPLIAALLLPPTPWIVLALLGARWLHGQRAAGWLLLLPACLGLWLSSSSAVGDAIVRGVLKPPPALTEPELAALKTANAAKPGEIAIVVLGGGREALAPEYGVSNLGARSVERLRYGVWLSRTTGIPLAFSGGVGHSERGESSEAEIAARIAAQEFNRPLKWVEVQSRDTRENGAYSVGLLRPLGINRIVVVTHGWHMQRALSAFEAELRRSGDGITLTAAPMGLAQVVDTPALRWLPTSEGIVRVRDALRECIGRLAGA